MTKKKEASSTPSSDVERSDGKWAIAAVTAIVTLTIMVLSFTFGGMASTSAKVDSVHSGFYGWAITVHLATAILALLLGPVILRRKKGDATHKVLGRSWAALMLTTALASAFIRTPGAGIAGTGFSFIHLFTVWTLGALPLAIYAARKGEFERHQRAMTGLYIGLCVAGAFTLIPGRVLGNLVFGG